MQNEIKSRQEFVNEVLDVANKRPVHIRKGQAVFNYIDFQYGVARMLQFEYGLDCFYTNDDQVIDEFINKAYDILCGDGSEASDHELSKLE